MGEEKNVRLPGLFVHLGPLFTASVWLMEPEMVHSAVRPLHHMYRSFTHSILWVQLTPGCFLSPKHHLGHRVSDHSKNVLNCLEIQRSSLGVRNGEECLKKVSEGGAERHSHTPVSGNGPWNGPQVQIITPTHPIIMILQSDQMVFEWF